jgi:hypothetical protein
VAVAAPPQGVKGYDEQATMLGIEAGER